MQVCVYISEQVFAPQYLIHIHISSSIIQKCTQDTLGRPANLSVLAGTHSSGRFPILEQPLRCDPS